LAARRRFSTLWSFISACNTEPIYYLSKLRTVY
jgi:hypothetical protein